MCIDEIAQRFVSGELIGSSYIKTVTLSNGATRTVKLTPMVHETFGEVVELNDSGHVSYMGLNGATTNGRLMVRLREFPMAYPDEKSCAAAMLASPSVQNLYKALGTDAQIIASRLQELPEQEDNPDSLHLLMADRLRETKLAATAGATAPELLTLCGLLIHGTSDIKQALTPSGGQGGDIAFLVVHRQQEAELQRGWPVPHEQTGNVLLMNDPVTQMSAVTDALQASFGMDAQSANRKMLEVHESGSSVLECAPDIDVTDKCRRLNAQWRAAGLPLYCVPQRKSPEPHHRLGDL